MTYCLKYALCDTVRLFGPAFKKIKLKTSYAEDFKREFEGLRLSVLSKMKSSNKRGLDAHKLAAIACLSVMLSRPLYVPANGEGHASNEVVAFLLAIHIIRCYQIERFCPDKSKWGQMEAAMGSLSTPDLIYDNQPVNVNTIFSFRHLSRVLCKSENKSDFAFLMSSLFFYIDAHSQAAVKDCASAIT